MGLTMPACHDVHHIVTEITLDNIVAIVTVDITIASVILIIHDVA
jgi:hypothetical protein